MRIRKSLRDCEHARDVLVVLDQASITCVARALSILVSFVLYLCVCAHVSYLCVTCDQVSFLLVSWSMICCQDDCLPAMAFAKGALPEEYLSHNWLARGCMPAHQHCDVFYPLGWGSAWVYCKLGNAPVLRSGTGSWVLSDKSGACHPLSPVTRIRLGLRK